MTIRSQKTALISLIAGTALTLGACASSKEPSFGDQLQQSGQYSASMGTAWNDGQEMETRGLKLMEEGKSLTQTSERKKQEGEDMITSGRQQISGERAAYARAVRDLGVAATAKQVETESKELDKIADNWRDAERRIERGEGLIKESGKLAAKGDAKKREGETLVFSGREQMRRVETAVAPAAPQPAPGTVPGTTQPASPQATNSGF